MSAPAEVAAFPLPLSAYPPASPDGVLATLAERIAIEPFNAVATGIFVLAIVHTFAAARFTTLAHHMQHRHDERARAKGLPLRPSVAAELLHFLGEIEVVFGLWAIVLIVALTGYRSLEVAKHYVNDTVIYTEALFVVVIMALASTRPIVGLRRSRRCDRSRRSVAARRLRGGWPS